QLGTANDSVLQTLIALFKDDNWTVRSRAAEALGQLGIANETVLEALIALLKDDASDVRYRAAEALGQLGTQSETIEPLLARWIEQHQTKRFVDHGIDVLQALVR
ncbi:MAG: HEAT repeat domain-containing protein, partial [Cyanobacteria bacterium P01_D01_bin.36]